MRIEAIEDSLYEFITIGILEGIFSPIGILHKSVDEPMDILHESKQLESQA